MLIGMVLASEITALAYSFSGQGMNVNVDFYSPAIVRVCKTPEGEKADKTNISLSIVYNLDAGLTGIRN